MPAVDPVCVDIVSPTHYSEVSGSGTFDAFGYCEPSNGTVKGKVRHWDGTAFVETNGTPQTPTSPYDWQLSFTGISTTVWAVLEVTVEHPSGSHITSKSHSIFCT